MGTIGRGRGRDFGPVEFMVSVLDNVVVGQEVKTNRTYQMSLTYFFQQERVV
jgi:hypothetical protein